MRVPENLAKTIIGVHKDKGENWIKSFPELVHYVEKKWELEIQEPYNLSYNFVAPARKKDGTYVVVKMSVPNKELVSEANWLQYNKNGKIANLIDSEVESGILILDRLEHGDPLSTVKDENQSIFIAANVMKTIWKEVPKSHSFPTIHEWAKGLERLRNIGSELITEELVTRAENGFSLLIKTMREPILLHGDLHQDNILSTHDGWRAIDPKGLIGEAEIEVIAFLRNCIWEQPNPKQALKNRVLLFSQQLQLDEDRIVQWGFCLSILSAWWCIESATDGAESSVNLALLFEELSRNS